MRSSSHLTNRVQTTFWAIHNSCHWPILHYPNDLCFWESIRTDEGTPDTLFYQDDGFGNLILLNREHARMIQSFIYGAQNH